MCAACSTVDGNAGLCGPAISIGSGVSYSVGGTALGTDCPTFSPTLHPWPTFPPTSAALSSSPSAVATSAAPTTVPSVSPTTSTTQPPPNHSSAIHSSPDLAITDFPVEYTTLFVSLDLRELALELEAFLDQYLAATAAYVGLTIRSVVVLSVEEGG